MSPIDLIPIYDATILREGLGLSAARQEAAGLPIYALPLRETLKHCFCQ